MGVYKKLVGEPCQYQSNKTLWMQA